MKLPKKYSCFLKDPIIGYRTGIHANIELSSIAIKSAARRKWNPSSEPSSSKISEKKRAGTRQDITNISLILLYPDALPQIYSTYFHKMPKKKNTKAQVIAALWEKLQGLELNFKLITESSPHVSLSRKCNRFYPEGAKPAFHFVHSANVMVNQTEICCEVRVLGKSVNTVKEPHFCNETLKIHELSALGRKFGISSQNGTNSHINRIAGSFAIIQNNARSIEYQKWSKFFL